MEQEYIVSRSNSATSSLDPYYFGIQSPSDSPVSPLANGPIHLSTTPDQRVMNDPITPARDAAMIDRRGLVGVGELTTPRWTRAERTSQEESPDQEEGFEVVVPEDIGDEDEPDSPWTIEAVDGESSDKEEVSEIHVFHVLFERSNILQAF
jgi:dual specificity tyrosine-phosphorylation-regulated kinase 2/3/4